MFVVNTSPKVMGFGGVIVLQNEMAQLPPQFTAEHPTIKFYKSRGWLSISSNSTQVTAPSTPTADADIETTDASDTPDTPLTPRDVSRMNLGPLQELATSLGIEFAGSVTRAFLIERISAELFPEGSDVKDEDASAPETDLNEQG